MGWIGLWVDVQAAHFHLITQSAVGCTVRPYGDCCVSGSGAWTHGEPLVVSSARPARHSMCSGNHHAQWNYFLLLCSAGRARRQICSAADDVVDICGPFARLLVEHFHYSLWCFYLIQRLTLWSLNEKYSCQCFLCTSANINLSQETVQTKQKIASSSKTQGNYMVLWGKSQLQQLVVSSQKCVDSSFSIVRTC